MNINERLFEILAERNFTQKALSEKTGISESTISDWKRKNKTPGIEKLVIICKTLGVSIYDIISDGKELQNEYGYFYELNNSEKTIIDMFRSSDEGQQKRILTYLEQILTTPQEEKRVVENETKIEKLYSDKFFLQQKLLAKRIRKLAKLDRIQLDETEHVSTFNLHLLKYLDFIGIDKLTYIKQYLANIQPFMISEIKSQEKFDNAICILDDFYRISIYIKINATKGEEIIVSFHENNKAGIARKNAFDSNLSYVYVFADSIGSYIQGTENYTINLFITRGVSSFPINVPASKYDDDGFLVRYIYISNAIIDIANQYLEDLYSSDIDFNRIDLFSTLQQLSFTSYGNDIFSNISLMIDSLLIQSTTFGKQIADSALCIYCSSLNLLDNDKKELIVTLKERYRVNSVRALPQILERVEMNL